MTKRFIPFVIASMALFALPTDPAKAPVKKTCCPVTCCKLDKACDRHCDKACAEAGCTTCCDKASKAAPESKGHGHK
jgi:hypothetical protein